MLTLILGGARSGKSCFAEKCATKSGKQVIYIATATPGDTEMRERIARHRLDRPTDWPTIEEPVHLAKALEGASKKGNLILVDCLTLWLSNILFNQQGELQLSVFNRHKDELLDLLPRLPGDILLVSNEVGQGLVAVSATTRRFVDEAGWLHLSLAQICDRVVLITAGLPMFLKK